MQTRQSAIELATKHLRRMFPTLWELQSKQKDNELSLERGQTVVRVVLTALIFLYLVASYYPVNLSAGIPNWLLCIVVFSFFSVAILFTVFNSAEKSAARRTIVCIGDVVAITYLMILTDKIGVPLFVLYLWLTLGNGLRFGFRSMTTSAALSLTGFSLVLSLTPAWQQLVTVAIAVTVALIALPIYSAYLLRQRNSPASKIEATTQPARQTPETPPTASSHALSRERGQALTRLGVCSTVFVYLLVREYPITEIEPWLLFCFGYLTFSVVIVTSALLDSKQSLIRRVTSNAADVGAITYLMVATGETGFPLFVLYLWITLGNGFRFGLPAMITSALLSLVGFSVVVAFSDLWKSHPMFATGVIAGLLLIPAYTMHLIRQLHLARRRAEEASKAKGDFLARMSHELRTPLNGILSTTELLSVSKRFNREDRSLLQVIRDSVQVSMRQIDNVLDFSKIEAGKLIIEQTSFDLHELLNRTIRLVRSMTVEKNIRLTLRIDPAIPFKLIGDPHHVQEVLMNLLSNAVKFTEKGYVSVDMRLSQRSGSQLRIRLEVHDTGIGIDAAALGHIFEAFSQEDSGTSRRYGGTGLGTTIAKQLVELMGGQLSVVSAKGEGSTFFAELPFEHQADAPEAERNLAGLRVLLISANAPLANHIASLAKNWGTTTQTTATPAEAEGLLRRNIRVGNPFHIVLVDSRSVFGYNDSHGADDLLQKTSAASIPVFLLCDVAPEEAQLRQWGYAGVLSYDLPQDIVFNALHTGYFFGDDSHKGIARIEPWAWGQTARQRARLLVADDNRTNLMILRKILESANYEVDAVENGEQALEMMLRGRYKAAVLDMHMPGLDGIAVIKQYRAMRHGARTPIVMLTANATVNAKLESAEAGADAYLTKPATAATIINTIERLLDDSEVHELAKVRAIEPVPHELAVLDTTPITELDRLYNNPSAINQILDEFETESRRMLQGISTAVAKKNHAMFCDLLHALRGNGANVGTLRLVHACQTAEQCGLIEFHRDGKQLLRQLETSFEEAIQALRNFTSSAERGPSAGPAN
jgi:two-component system sensor histidine kinase RpfC